MIHEIETLKSRIFSIRLFLEWFGIISMKNYFCILSKNPYEMPHTGLQ